MPKRALIAAECIGDGYWFIDKATKYANERVVFDRSIGKNQGVQFPIARAYVNVEGRQPHAVSSLRAVRCTAAVRAEANMAKASGSGRLLGGGQCVPADARRVWLCLRI